MTDAMKKRVFGVSAVVIALTALGVVSMSDLGENLVYYWTPSDLVSKPNATDATVRLAGMVVAGSYSWDQNTHIVEFDLTDGPSTVHVVNKGNPPQMFREGIGAVVEGKLGTDNVFRSDKVIVKHDERYQAGEQTPEEIMKNLAQTLEEES